MANTINSDAETRRLTELASEPVGRLLWRYSLPAVVGMLVMALYNVIDRIFIGQWVGPDAIAGLAITFPVMNITTAIGVLIGVGASARTSIALGQRQYDKAEKILGNTLTFTLLNGVVYIALLGVFMDPMLRLFGASEVTLPYARDFMLIMLPGCLATNMAFSLNNLIRSSGYPRVAMFTMLIGAAVNVVLDPIFIYVFEWGIAGAAIATDIAMFVSAGFVVAHFMRRNVTVRFRRGIFRPDWKLLLSIMAIGAAPAIVNISSCVVNALANHALLDYGTDRDIGAAGIMVTYTSLMVTLVLGICQGMQPIVGYNYGARNLHRLRRAYFLAVACATVVTTAGGLFGFFYPGVIGRIFTTDPELIASTERALGTCLAVFPVVGFQVVSTSFFQSIDKASESIFVGLLRQVVVLIPLLLILPSYFGLDGVWMAFPGSDAVSTLITAFLVYYQLKKIKAINA